MIIRRKVKTNKPNLFLAFWLGWLVSSLESPKMTTLEAGSCTIA